MTTQGVPLVGSTETSEAFAIVAGLHGSTAAAAESPDAERLRIQDEKKRKQRSGKEATQVTSTPTSASAALLGYAMTSAGVVEKLHLLRQPSARTSPRKVLQTPVSVTGNWSVSCDVRMVLIVISPAMEPLLKMLGHPADRAELQGSTADNKCDSTHAFFQQLTVAWQ